MTAPRFSLLAAGLAATAIFAAGCGDDSSDDPTKVDVGVTETGNESTLEIPAEIEGGAVELTLDNSANKAPHAAQLVQIGEGHTAEEAIAIIDNQEPVEIPEWIRAYGGVGSVAPGQTGTATVKLDEGHYLVQDDAGQGGGPSPQAEFDVDETNDADLPDTDATVTAATTGEEDPEYEWEVDGLKAGSNTFTFVSEGEKALHNIIAAPIVGESTIEQVQQDLDSNGPPRSIDFENIVGTPVIDGEKEQVAKFDLQAGRYALICFLPDRDEPDEPHYKQGLLKEVTIGQ